MNQPGSAAAEGLHDALPDENSETIPPVMKLALAFLVRVGGISLLRDVTRLFATTCDERIVGLRDALALGNRRELARLAHALKGSAAQVGAEDLRRSASTLERESTAASPDALRGIVDDLAVASRLASARLDSYLRAAGERE